MGPGEKAVGERCRQRDGDLVVTGAAIYTADIALAGMLHGAIVRSTHPHARILGVDGRAALALSGVAAVIDGAAAAEICGPIPPSLDPAHLGGNRAEIRCLALERTRYVGEPIAVVVADTPAAASAAARAVAVSYEPLKAVLDADEALAPGAPLLFEEWGTNAIIAGGAGRDDFDEAASTCEHRLSGELRSHRGNAAPIEPRAWLADWDRARGRLTLYATSQNPHPLRTTLAKALRLAETHVHVIAPRAGGSFGLKMYGNREDFLAAVMAISLGRPVRLLEERGASLLPGAHEQIHRYEVAFSADGRVEALRVRSLANHGAPAPGHGWGMAFVCALTMGAGYAIEHVRAEYTVVATNKAPWNGTKPFGKDGAALVLEHVMEEVAQTTGLDPAEVRRRNMLAPERLPYVTPTGIELDSGRYEEALDRVLARLDYAGARADQRARREDSLLVGIGLGFEVTPEGADIPGALVGGFDTSTVRLEPDGQATVLTGVTSPGGGNDTAIAQLVADELGLLPGDVDVVQGDTDRCPYGFGNISSRSLVAGGGAAVLAARDVAARVRIVAGRMLESDPGQVALAGGLARAGGRSIPISAVAEAVPSLGYLLALEIEPNLESTRSFRPTNIRHTPDAEGRLQPYGNYPYAVHAAVIEVDGATGVVRLHRHVVVHDCGTQVNPMFVEGQVHGGVAMGAGAALGEEFRYGEDGQPLSDGFKTYLLARASDLPAIELEHMVTPSPFTLLGAKGAGEAGYAGAQAAVFNAVNDAIRPLGASLRQLPASAPNVLAALAAAQ
jgi:aerobic carbon-monoxide dehydrogenase large subunit